MVDVAWSLKKRFHEKCPVETRHENTHCSSYAMVHLTEVLLHRGQSTYLETRPKNFLNTHRVRA